MAGIKLPNWAERHEILITEPVDPGVCPPMLMSFSGNYYIQQRPHGSIIAGESPSHEPLIGYTSTVHSGETDVKHFWHATGFSGHGFMLGPVAGQIMTALLNGDKPPIDPTIMDYRRFERGERIVEPNVV